MQRQTRCSKFFFSSFFIGLAVLFLSGCALVPEPLLPDHKITLNIKSSADVNPNEANVASPITLKVYELSSPDAFQASDFVPLFQNPKAILGADMLAPEQTIQITPDSKLGAEFKVKRDTKYLGVVAAYQNIQNSQWRLLLPLGSNWGSESKWIDVNKNSIIEES